MDCKEISSPSVPRTILGRIFKDGEKHYHWSLILVLLSIFATETVAMALVYSLDLSGGLETFIDASFLALIAYPLLYVFFLKPLQKQYQSATEAHIAAETLAAASMQLSQTLELSKVFQILLDRVMHLSSYEFASLYLLETPSRLVIQETRGYERIDDENETMWFDPAENHVISKILQDEKGVVVPDIHQEPGWSSRKGMVFVHSWIGIPLVVGGKVIGLLGLGTREINFYTQEHLRLCEVLVGQAAAAIQNAWLFEQIRNSNEQLHILTRQLVEVQEIERANLARELHDEVGQTLTSLIVDLKRLEQKSSQPEAVLSIVSEMDCSFETIAENLHRLAVSLRPAALDHLGLAAALNQHIEMIRKRYDLRVHINFQDLKGRLPVEMETPIYRIVQESLNNVIRHARANNVDIVAQQRDGNLILLIEDDGVGFDVDTALNSGRLGLIGMRERAEIFGGNLVIESSPGKGTTIQIEVPYAFADTYRG